MSSGTSGPGSGVRSGTPLRRLPELNMVFPDRPPSAASNASFAGGRAPSRASTVGPTTSGAVVTGTSGGDLPSIDSYMRSAHGSTPTPRIPPGASSASSPSAQMDRIPTRAEMERHYALMRDERQRLAEMLGTTDRMLASMRRALDATASQEEGPGASTSVPLRRSSGGVGRGGESGSVWALSTTGGESSSS